MRGRTLFVALVALVVPSVSATATPRAVIVGASEFIDPRLAGFALPGATRDADKMRATLSALGIRADDMVVLTGRDATLGTIRAALNRLADASQAGDRAVIFLSGHGTQAPARAGDMLEPDGKDELFLAADAGRWNGSSFSLPGALTDDEIGRRVGELRARGVDVWMVIDSCTGGGLLRSGAKVKSIPPLRLGIPVTAPMRGAVDASGFIDGGLAGGGRLVAFAAAGADGVAWDDGDGGAFTTALTQASTPQPSSFAALAARTSKAPRAGGTLGNFWTAGDLSAPILFAGRSPDLLELARSLPPLPFEARLSIDQAGACPGQHRSATDRPVATSDGVTKLRHCDHVRVDMVEPAAPFRVEAWYRDAGGGYTSLVPPLGLIVAPGRWANIGFTFVTRDPATGRHLPQGEEALVLIARDVAGTAIGASLLRFAAI